MLPAPTPSVRFRLALVIAMKLKHKLGPPMTLGNTRKVLAPLGTVEAPDEKSAIANAAEQFNIPSAV